ncbi:di-trans,poly-cis-decaprenylcistransferase [Occallatibacter riparius]|uniref:Isoprenyl transferase n=1 Tax=Occallatibacter riparius TaxID=1002689 RepID=A0A9J7BL98_9BACT|nr:di-trans,poly-cis-decaprenylcistransferase [Occallatibacter riparius]UWZ82546.1 di-trans,poly-cis-decaprenylcistransferase [Occallatibacter riparius]
MSHNFTSQSGDGLHVAIIMDGNGRWATRRGLPRVAGHRAGVAALKRIVEHAPDVGIRALTVYAFSADNWARPAGEVQSLFWLMRAFLRLETERLRQKSVRMQIIGRRDRIPAAALREVNRSEFVTAAGRRLLFRVAIDYSARDAIARAASSSPAQEASVSAARSAMHHELTREVGEVDLLIRTGGEKRLSDFLLWESAYAELYFTDCMWPDFSPAELDAALAEFRHRERRFGAVPTAAVAAGGSR